uniref:Uncharacterized protein n=1 Tax=Chromera velia CCMP2878 TaxID=1169474 RepID=A0A0G4I767_9ALVE|eukprot:Cvel_36497.t1-p1 / transcript=Cvel_36497.t1 / gene=Cvel_36497 / organism=Chromera_velia_CCMP2878 / gene_product=hypothetical protein / transcript_product=hypothetical protein / location=Cvel_scaffold7342:994-1380(+) / protein_length=129 / sequence_SO=supercontig / SO=protein_coding / is_pseudo=false
METSPNAKLLGELQGLLTDIVREATVPASVLLCSVLGAYFVAHVVAKCCLRRSQGECLGCKRNPWNNTNWRERLFKFVYTFRTASLGLFSSNSKSASADLSPSLSAFLCKAVPDNLDAMFRVHEYMSGL